MVHQFVGHGVGCSFHEAPQVPHHRNNTNVLLVPGITFTIEPMINAGVAEGILDKKDQWTMRIQDGQPSAQWEHTTKLAVIGSQAEVKEFFAKVSQLRNSTQRC